MSRANTYYPKSTTFSSPSSIGNPSTLPHQDKIGEAPSKAGRVVSYGHTVADVEQQILDWLKEMQNTGNSN